LRLTIQPAKEEQEYVDAIKEDLVVRFNWPKKDILLITFNNLYDWSVDMIKNNKAT
jgi:hypothetical protein